MLSATHSMQEMDTVLTADNIPYSAALRPAGFVRALNEAMLKYMYPFISSIDYTIIAALDRTGLSESQEYLFMAEVYFAVSIFIKGLALSDEYNRGGDSSSISIEGYSESVSGASGRSRIAGYYLSQGYLYLTLAGYEPMKLKRC